MYLTEQSTDKLHHFSKTLTSTKLDVSSSIEALTDFARSTLHYPSPSWFSWAKRVMVRFLPWGVAFMLSAFALVGLWGLGMSVATFFSGFMSQQLAATCTTCFMAAVLALWGHQLYRRVSKSRERLSRSFCRPLFIVLRKNVEDGASLGYRVSDLSALEKTFENMDRAIWQNHNLYPGINVLLALSAVIVSVHCGVALHSAFVMWGVHTGVSLTLSTALLAVANIGVRIGASLWLQRGLNSRKINNKKLVATLVQLSKLVKPTLLPISPTPMPSGSMTPAVEKKHVPSSVKVVEKRDPSLPFTSMEAGLEQDSQPLQSSGQDSPSSQSSGQGLTAVPGSDDVGVSGQETTKNPSVLVELSEASITGGAQSSTPASDQQSEGLSILTDDVVDAVSPEHVASGAHGLEEVSPNRLAKLLGNWGSVGWNHDLSISSAGDEEVPWNEVASATTSPMKYPFSSLHGFFRDDSVDDAVAGVPELIATERQDSNLSGDEAIMATVVGSRSILSDSEAEENDSQSVQNGKGPFGIW